LSERNCKPGVDLSNHLKNQTELFNVCLAARYLEHIIIKDKTEIKGCVYIALKPLSDILKCCLLKNVGMRD